MNRAAKQNKNRGSGSISAAWSSVWEYNMKTTDTLDLFVLYLSDCLLRGIATGEGDEGVTTVQASHGIHHETQVPDRPALLKQGDELVFVEVSRYLTTKYLSEGDRQRAVRHNLYKPYA